MDEEIKVYTAEPEEVANAIANSAVRAAVRGPQDRASVDQSVKQALQEAASHCIIAGFRLLEPGESEVARYSIDTQEGQSLTYTVPAGARLKPWQPVPPRIAAALLRLPLESLPEEKRLSAVVNRISSMARQKEWRLEPEEKVRRLLDALQHEGIIAAGETCRLHSWPVLVGVAP